MTFTQMIGHRYAKMTLNSLANMTIKKVAFWCSYVDFSLTKAIVNWNLKIKQALTYAFTFYYSIQHPIKFD